MPGVRHQSWQPGARQMHESTPTNHNTTENLWLSLDELRQAALQLACTPAQFAFAVEATGAHPVRVARYLKLHGFIPETFEIPGE